MRVASPPISFYFNVILSNITRWLWNTLPSIKTQLTRRIVSLSYILFVYFSSSIVCPHFNQFSLILVELNVFQIVLPKPKTTRYFVCHTLSSANILAFLFLVWSFVVRFGFCLSCFFFNFHWENLLSCKWCISIITTAMMESRLDEATCRKWMKLDQ